MYFSLWGLGVFGLLFCVFGICLANNPDNSCNKGCLGFWSIILAGCLVFFGRPILFTAWNIEEEIDLYCKGGFPKFSDVSKYMIT